ncbi:MAG: hypothetical protein ACKOCH_10705, partial [Bacteroidota bacterium]
MEQCRLDGVPEDQCSLTDKLLGDFSTVHVGWLLMVMLAFTVSNIFRMDNMFKKAIQFLLFFGIGATILYLVFRSQNAAFMEQCRLDGVPEDQCSLTDKLLGDFSTVHVGWLLM